MPFSKTTDNHDEGYWSRFFEEFITPALQEYGYKAYRSVDTPNNITKKIVRELAMADLVVAVLTDGKPNVLYELGVRHSLRFGTIMTLEGDHRPFDVSNYGILSYKDNDLDGFKKDLGRYIKAAEEQNEDSPVADFLNQKITVSVNLAIARLRQTVDLLRFVPSDQFDMALTKIREQQQLWKPKSQVSVVRDNRVVLHVDPNTESLTPDQCWQDETLGTESLFPLMKQSRAGFRIAQIKQATNRLTAIAFETVDEHACLVVSEAHYLQEVRPY